MGAAAGTDIGGMEGRCTGSCAGMAGIACRCGRIVRPRGRMRWLRWLCPLVLVLPGSRLELAADHVFVHHREHRPGRPRLRLVHVGDGQRGRSVCVARADSPVLEVFGGVRRIPVLVEMPAVPAASGFAVPVHCRFLLGLTFFPFFPRGRAYQRIHASAQYMQGYWEEREERGGERIYSYLKEAKTFFPTFFPYFPEFPAFSRLRELSSQNFSGKKAPYFPTRR